MVSKNLFLLQILAALTLAAASAGAESPVPVIAPATTQGTEKDLAPAPNGESRELKEGDLPPDIELVNQAGEKTWIHDSRGKALAITFFYSRCSAATYCPLVSRNFDTAQELLARLGASDRCHLLSISMDPENDVPAVLTAYAKAVQANPRIWTFATAREADMRRFGNAVGLEFRRVGGRIEHNLRTVVLDASGRIRRIFRGNEWTPQELAAELRLAMLTGE
jgi:protein SCO1/2